MTPFCKKKKTFKKKTFWKKKHKAYDNQKIDNRKDSANSTKKGPNQRVESSKVSEITPRVESKVSDFQHECVLTIE